MALSIMAEHCFPECHLRSVTYAECHIYRKPFMLSVVMLNVILLNAVMLSVFMLSVVMLSVVAPLRTQYLHYCIFHSKVWPILLFMAVISSTMQ